MTRFAPSPTGLLHRGHAFAALMAFDRAHAAGGRFLLRIEDIDSTRCREPFVAALLEDLAWLGLKWRTPVVRQSERFAAYAVALERLRAQGLVYPCFCTRREIAAEIARSGEAPQGPDGPVYPGTCRALDAAQVRRRMAEESYALRLDVARAARQAGPLWFDERGRGPHGECGRIRVDPFRSGDVVLARKEMPVSYQLAVVVDDAWQGVSCVTRAEDLFAATHVQRLLQVLLGLPTPQYAHHQLIRDAHGRKLSKRDSAPALRDLRAQGVTVAQLRELLGLGRGPCD